MSNNVTERYFIFDGDEEISKLFGIHRRAHHIKDTKTIKTSLGHNILIKNGIIYYQGKPYFHPPLLELADKVIVEITVIAGSQTHLIVNEFAILKSDTDKITYLYDARNNLTLEIDNDIRKVSTPYSRRASNASHHDKGIQPNSFKKLMVEEVPSKSDKEEDNTLLEEYKFTLTDPTGKTFGANTSLDISKIIGMSESSAKVLRAQGTNPRGWKCQKN